MSLEALIFDVDGTLADTEEAHRHAFNQAFEHHRIGWQWDRDTYRDLLKITGGKERLAAYLARQDLSAAEQRRLRELLPLVHEEKTACYSRFVAAGGLMLRPGVARLCGEALAAGRRLAIASTTTAVNVDRLLQSAFGERGLDMFSVIVCGDQVRAKKPAPDIYRLALEHLGVQPECAVAFEDSVNGLRSAHGAGVWTVVTPTPWTEGDDFSAADLLLPHLGDPGQPLAGEPGGQLQDAAWLGFAELERRADRRTPNPVAALYAA